MRPSIISSLHGNSCMFLQQQSGRQSKVKMTMKVISLLSYSSLITLSAVVPSFTLAFAPRNPIKRSSRQVNLIGQDRQCIYHPSLVATTALRAATPTEEDLKRFKSYGEASRKFRRSYFSHSDWLKARADDRFLYNLSSILRSGIVRQLSKEIVLVASIASFICIYNAIFIAGYDDFAGFHHPPVFDTILPVLKLPSEPFTFASPSLGLLLVFRTNTAYKRWDEGRKAWGAIINSCRTCVRLGTVWYEQSQASSSRSAAASKELLERLSDAVWSFPRSLQFHLLGPLEDGANYARDLQQLRDQQYAQDLLAVRHKPTRALKEITTVLHAMPFESVIYQVETEKAVTTLCDSLGACERIFTSPPPMFYSRHTARFLVTWLFLLPLCLWDRFGTTWNHWGVIPTIVVISYFLLGIEELAAQMEEPFSILPMDKMTGGIRLSVDEHVDWKSLVDMNDEKENGVVANGDSGSGDDETNRAKDDDYYYVTDLETFLRGHGGS